MERVGASTEAIDAVVGSVERGEPLDDSLAHGAVPEAAASFVRTTFSAISTGESHRIAAAFTLAREDLIPEMFHSHVRALNRESDDLDLYTHYLERPMELDEEEHGPMALRMLVEVCGDEPQRWEEARTAASRALQARLDLWDAVARAVE